MAIALDPRVPFTYTLKSDRELPNEQQTEWELRPLKHSETAEVAALQAENPMPLLVSVGRRIIVGWKRWSDGKGDAVEFKKGPDGYVHEDLFNRIPMGAVLEMASAALSAAQVEREDRD